MSEENVKVVRKLVQAFNQRDLDGMTECLAPEVEWEPAGPAAVERDLYRGRDEVSKGFAAAWETWEVFQVEESDLREVEDWVVWLGNARLRGVASQIDFGQAFAINFLVKAGMVIRFQGFLDRRAALEAAGLSE